MKKICILTLQRNCHKYFAAEICKNFPDAEISIIWQSGMPKNTNYDNFAKKTIGEEAYNNFIAENKLCSEVFPNYYSKKIEIENELFKNYKSDEFKSAKHFTTRDINQDAKKLLGEIKPDILLVFGGPVLKKSVFELNIPKIINQHTGYLPDYRGANTVVLPILEDNLDKIAVSIHDLTPNLDKGEIYARGYCPIYKNDRFSDLFYRLTLLGTKSVIDVTQNYFDNQLKPIEKSGEGKLYYSFDVTNFQKIEADLKLKEKIQIPYIEFANQKDEYFIVEGESNLIKLDEFKNMVNKKPTLINIYYHGVSDYKSKYDDFVHNVPLDMFEKHIEFFATYFKSCKLEDGIKKLKSGKLKETMFTVSFDDGFKSVLDNAYPVLKKNNIPFTIFCNSDFMKGKDICWEAKYKYLKSKKIFSDDMSLEPVFSNFNVEKINQINHLYDLAKNDEFFKDLYLTKKDIAKMDEDLCDISNHSVSHYKMSSLSEAEAINQIECSHNYLKKIKNYKSLFAFPYSDSNKEVRDLALKSHDYNIMVGQDINHEIKNKNINRIAIRSYIPSLELARFYYEPKFYKNKISKINVKRVLKDIFPPIVIPLLKNLYKKIRERLC